MLNTAWTFSVLGTTQYLLVSLLNNAHMRSYNVTDEIHKIY